jgi:outer membrane protein TolC
VALLQALTLTGRAPRRAPPRPAVLASALALAFLALLPCSPALAQDAPPSPAPEARPEPAPALIQPPPQEPPVGLGLAELLERSLSLDGRIRAAHARLDAYRARHAEARWAIFPVVQLELGIGGPLGERKLACPDDPNCLEIEGSRDNLESFSADHLTFAVGGKISGALPLYTFGKWSAAKDAARAGVEAGEEDVTRMRQEVALEVRRAWYAWQLARAAVAALEDGEATLKDVEQKLDRMLEELAEGVSEQDRFKLRFHAAQVRAMLIQARQGRALALAALRFLTDLPGLGEAEPLAGIDLEAPTLPPLERDALVARAQRARADLRMLRAARRAAGALVELQRSMFYPDIGLKGTFEGYYSPGQDYIENSLLNNGWTRYGGSLMLGLQVSLDIPQKLARLERAEAELRQVEAQLELAERGVALDVERRLEDVLAARDSLQAQRDGQRAARAWLRTNMMSYGVGLANTRDMLDSVAAHAKADLERQKGIHDLLSALDALRLALGEDLGEWP